MAELHRRPRDGVLEVTFDRIDCWQIWVKPAGEAARKMYLELAQSFADLLQVLGQRTIYWMNRGE